MYIPKGIRLQLNFLRFFGLLPVFYSKNDLKWVLGMWEELILLCWPCILIFCSSFYCFWKPFWLISQGHNKTGVRHELFATSIASFGQIITNLCLYFGKNKNLDIIQSAVNLENKYYVCKTCETSCNDKTLRLFHIYLGVCFVCSINMVYMYSQVQTWDFVFVCQFIIYCLQLFLSGLILIFYASIVVIISDTLTIINEQILSNILVLDSSVHKKNKLKSLLRDRAEIIVLCEHKISLFYRVPILCILSCVLTNGSMGPFYAVSVLDHPGRTTSQLVLVFLNLLTLWTGQFFALPIITFSLDVTNEVNQTARILSRISRKGTGVEKMIDKFMIKNMQQKPILTAYGFFPLNKRTLFKIFAAIFTYMVILIQFKDMENKNKTTSSEMPSTTVSASTYAG